MSDQHVSVSPQINEAESDANSKADAIAILSLIAIVVTMAVFYVSR